MRIAVLANTDSWYYRDLTRAAADLRFDCTRADFTQLTATIGSARLTDSHFSRSPLEGEGGRRPDEEEFTDELRSLHTIHVGDLPLTPRPSPVRGEGGKMPNVVLVRTMPPGSLEQVVYRMDALARLEASGVRVINSSKSLECAVDKYLTTSKCHADGLPVPDTVVCETEEAALAAFEELGDDVVVKPLFGAEGRGIVRVSDPDLALRAFRTLSRLQAVLYLQRFVPHPGFDVRVLVLGGKVLGGMKRFAADGDFRTNVSRQAQAERHAPTDAEGDFALRAAAATGAWFAGVDLLYDRDGRCYVIEVNAVPGWKAFASVNDIDVATVLLKRIESEIV